MNISTNTPSNDAIILVVDHKVRDLWRLVHLKVWLEDLYGYDVHLVPSDLRLLHNYAAAIAPQIIFWHHLRNVNMARFVDRFRACGIQTGLLHTEHLYGKASPTIREYYAKGDDWSLIDLAFVGHPAVPDAIREYTDLAPPKMIYLGNQVFDFYFPPYKQLLESHESFYRRYDLDPALPTILVVTSYPNADKVSDKEAGERFKKRSRVSDVWDYDEAAYEMYRNRALMIESMVALARALPQANLLWRPHPFEVSSPSGLTAYREALEAAGVYKRWRQVPEGFIGHVLNQADVMINYHSTSSIEAWLLDLPVIYLRAADMSLALVRDHEYPSGGDHIHTVADVVETTRRYLAEKTFPLGIRAERERILGYHFSGDWQGNITRRTAEAIHQHLQATRRAINVAPLYKTRRQYWSHRLKTALGLPPNLPELPVSERHASPQEIAEFAAQLRGVMAASPLAR